VFNETDIDPRKVQHEARSGSQTAASELRPPFLGWLHWLEPCSEIKGKDVCGNASFSWQRLDFY